MDIQHRFDNDFLSAWETTVFIKGDMLYRKNAPEDAKKIPAAKLTDIGYYDENLMAWEDGDHWVYVVSVSAGNGKNEPMRRTYGVFCNGGRGYAITYAYYMMWTEGGREDFKITAIGEVWPDHGELPGQQVIWMDTPGLPVYKLLEKLTDRNGRFVSELIDRVYDMTEEELLLSEKKELPHYEQCIIPPQKRLEDLLDECLGSSRCDDNTAPEDDKRTSSAESAEDVLIERMLRWCYCDDNNTYEASKLCDQLRRRIEKAQTNEEKKRLLNMFILFGLETLFLTTAYKTVLDDTLPDIGEFPS